MNRGLIVGGTMGVLVLAAGGYALYQSTLQEAHPITDVTRAATQASNAGTTRVQDGVSSPNGGVGHLPLPTAPSGAPWQGQSPTPTSGVPPLTVGKSGAPSLEDIQQRLQRVSTSGRPNIKELDAILADLQRNQGSAVVAGVNLQALRDNLARTDRIQQLAQEMQALAATPSPDTAARLQGMVKEIQQLQAAMQPTAAVSAQGPGR